jgi:hypothetical protein
VDATTLDDFFAAKQRFPDFLKIDVEGHELAVLEGAKRILQRHRPAVLVECETRHRPDCDVRVVFEFLQSQGYEGSFFLSGRRHPLREFNAAVHQQFDEATGEPARPYANNFAFVRRTI